MKKRINVSIDEETLYHLDGFAYEHGVDRSTMITLLVRKYVKDRKGIEDCDYYADLPLDTPYLKAVFGEK